MLATITLLARPLPDSGKGLYLFIEPLPDVAKAFFLLKILKGVSGMKKKKFQFEELIRKNKEELLKDKREIEKIEKRLDERYAKSQ